MWLIDRSLPLRGQAPRLWYCLLLMGDKESYLLQLVLKCVHARLREVHCSLWSHTRGWICQHHEYILTYKAMQRTEQNTHGALACLKSTQILCKKLLRRFCVASGRPSASKVFVHRQVGTGVHTIHA